MNNVSLESKVFRGASWLAIFKFLGQIFSWGTTIIVARILVPGDYGLMAMATIITGYAEMFSELGLGSAIIQKQKTNQDELSSVFWFSMFIAILLSLSCFPIAYITSEIFNNAKVIPLTKTMSLIFLFSGIKIVPLNILKKELKFKIIGIIEMTSTFVACIAMILLAKIGAGVWTLLIGVLTRSFVSCGLIIYKEKWSPKFHFKFYEAKEYLQFGITMAFGRSLFYIWEQSDRFFAARVWNSKFLGYYSFALQLAQIPTEKIVVLINQVAFPAFSKLIDNKDNFNKLYLNITKITATIVLPLFVGGYLVGEDMIKIFLNKQWFPMILLFKYLCLSQIMMAMNAINNFVHAAQGRPHWGLFYHIAGAIFMPLSFYFAVPYGLNFIILPWFTTFIIMCSLWILITLKKIEIPLIVYINNIIAPFIATAIMIFSVEGYIIFLKFLNFHALNPIAILVTKIAIGAFFYFGYLWFFNRAIFHNLRKMIN